MLHVCTFYFIVIVLILQTVSLHTFMYVHKVNHPGDFDSHLLAWLLMDNVVSESEKKRCCQLLFILHWAETIYHAYVNTTYSTVKNRRLVAKMSVRICSLWHRLMKSNVSLRTSLYLSIHERKEVTQRENANKGPSKNILWAIIVPAAGWWSYFLGEMLKSKHCRGKLHKFFHSV